MERKQKDLVDQAVEWYKRLTAASEMVEKATEVLNGLVAEIPQDRIEEYLKRTV